MTIKFTAPFLAGNELDYIAEVIQGGEFAGNGPFTNRVQELLERRYDVPRVLLTHSCTGALELAALALGLGAGDEVILPSFTFATTASSFLRTGATVRFCEVDPLTMNLDVNDALSRINSATKAIVPVHYGGIAAEMAPLIDFARNADMVVVEDAAQGLEAQLDGSWLGTIGHLGAISFHETKNLHSGLGGALFVNGGSFDRIEDMWERGTNRSKMMRGIVDKYTWVELGSSFYPSELQAAFLLAQLEAIDRNLAERRAIHDGYRDRLGLMEEAGWFRLPVVAANRTINYHSFFVIFDSTDDAEAVRLGLRSEDIHAHSHYVPLHSSPMGERLGYAAADFPVTEELAPRVLRMPLHSEMSLDDVQRVCEGVEKYLGRR